MTPKITAHIFRLRLTTAVGENFVLCFKMLQELMARG